MTERRGHTPALGVVSLIVDHRRAFGWLLLLIIVCSGLDLFIPFVTRGIVDRIVASLKGTPPPLRFLVAAGLAIFAATAAARLLRSLYNYRLFRTVSRCEDKLKISAFAHFLSLDTEYHSRVNTGEIIGALDRGCTALFVILYEILGQNLVPPLMIVAGVLISLFAKNAWIALVVLAPLPVYVLATWHGNRRIHEAEEEISYAFERVSKEAYDIASNVRSVKKFAHEQQESARQSGLLAQARELQFSGERLWALIDNSQSFVSTAGRVAVIVLGGYFVVAHRATVGDLVLFIAMQDMVYGPISQLSVIMPKLRRNLSRAGRIFDILAQPPKICDAPGARELSGAHHSVEFRDVSFRYPGSQHWALRDVNLSVPAGSVVALIGRSGSGKSTLVSLLQRLYDPDSGAILVNGRDLREVRQFSLREHVAVVPQEVELFSRTIHDNVAYGRNGATAEEVEDAARLAQAHAFIEKCDHSYHTEVGERGMRLSGGERQRIGIARAILHDPRILILDEATSHLDNENEGLIQAAFDKLIPGRTCFIIAHRLTTIQKADLVVVLNDGAVEAFGTHEQLWQGSPTYRKLNGPHLIKRKRPVRPVKAPALELACN